MRWVGTVVGNGQVLSWSSLEVGDEVRAHWLVRARFRLELEDGTSIAVDVSDREIEVLPVDERRERWGELESLPEARMFRARGPAPHTKVTFRTCSVSEGDRVTVFGDVAEEGFVDGAGHRDAVEKRPTLIRAERVVQGIVETEDDKPAPKPKDRTRFPLAYGSIVGMIWAIGCIAYAFFLYTKPGPLSPKVPDLLIFAATIGQFAILWQYHLGNAPGFIHRDKRMDFRPGWVLLGGAMLVYVFMCGAMVLWDGAIVNDRIVNNQPELVWGTLIASGIGAAWVAITGFQTLRLAKVILQAPRMTGLGVGTWGSLVGKVHDPTPVLGDAAMAMKRELDWTDGSGPHDLELTTHNLDTFLVRTKDGEVEIEAGEGMWATDVRRFPAWRGFAGFRVPVDGRLLLSTELIPQGASIVVAGRLQSGTPFQMKSVGPESLVFFATKPGHDPIAALWRVVGARLAMIVMFVVVAAAAYAMAYLTQGQLPEPYSYFPTGD